MSHRQWGVVALVTMVIVTVIAILLVYHGQPGGDVFGWPDPAVPAGVSRNGQDIHSLYVLISIPALVVFVVVEGLLAIIIWRFRRSRLPADYRPPQWSGHTVLEITWTVIPFLIVLVVGAASFHVMQQDEVQPTAAASTLEIHVVGYQYGWKYEYSNGVVINQAAGDPSQPMVIPEGQMVRLKVDSTDVIHSFWVPDVGVHSDAVPGYSNYTWMKINQVGEWRGQCAELCGSGHATMLINVKSVAPTDFQAWLHQEKLQESQASPSPTPASNPTPAPSPSASPSPSPSPAPSPHASSSPSSSQSPSGSPEPSPSS